MNGHGKSDSPMVPLNSPNNGGVPPAEGREGRGLAEGNSPQQNTSRAQDRERVRSALERVRQAAKRDKGLQFTSLLHHVYDLATLREAYFSLKRNAAPGVDGETWRHYGKDLEGNLQDLSERLKRGAYRARPVRRAYIPKPDGRQRPLGVTTLEDKLVQRATVEVLNAVYEVDFHAFSYGFRPGRSPHGALDALSVALTTRKVNWVLDADIRAYFDTIDHGWLVKLVERRIADPRVVRLIRKWLTAGVWEQGRVTWTEEGTPQGSAISPLLANVYLHYVFDVWIQAWRRTQAHGDVVVVRYADDFIVGFQYKSDAERFRAELVERFRQYGLALHPDKTRLIEFGRFADRDRSNRGDGPPESFAFLGFTHLCGKARSGKFIVVRRTARKRLVAKLRAVKAELMRRLHLPLPTVGTWLRSVVQGHFRYYGVPTNSGSLHAFRYRLVALWRRTLGRRSQRGRVTWDRMKRLAARWLPLPRICHPWPRLRSGVT